MVASDLTSSGGFDEHDAAVLGSDCPIELENSRAQSGTASLSQSRYDACGPLAEDRYDMRVKRATLVGQCPIDIHDKGRCVAVHTFGFGASDMWVAVSRQLASRRPPAPA